MDCIIHWWYSTIYKSEVQCPNLKLFFLYFCTFCAFYVLTFFSSFFGLFVLWYFVLFVLFVLLYFLIWLDGAYELPCKFGVRSCNDDWVMSTFGLMYFFLLFYFCNLFGLSIQTSMQNLESVAQKMAEILHNYVIIR